MTASCKSCRVENKNKHLSLGFVSMQCFTPCSSEPRISHRGRASVRGRGPVTWALFAENVCKNERIGPHGGGHASLDPPMFWNNCDTFSMIHII